MVKDKGRKKIEELRKKLSKLVIDYVPIGNVKPNEYNPNRQSEHEFELLCRSITEDGFTQPIICTNENVIVDGEHRWRAAQHLGMKEVPVVHVDYSETQRKIATLRHNRARGTEDIELTADLLKDLEKLGDIDWAKEGLGMSDGELERLLKDTTPPEEFGKDHEYNMAWVPTSRADADAQTNSEDQAVGSTAAAKQAEFVRGQRLEAAKSGEERDMIKKENAIKTLILTFSPDEFAIVHAVLGDSPAIKLVQMCNEVITKGGTTHPA